MVYNQEACVSSKDALRSYFLKIAMKNETGGCNNDRYRDVLREQRRLSGEMQQAFVHYALA